LGNGIWLDYSNCSFCCPYLGDSQSCVSQQKRKVNFHIKNVNTISISGSCLAKVDNAIVIKYRSDIAIGNKLIIY